MKHSGNTQVYLAQYEGVAELVRQPYSSIVGEQVLNHLLDRDALEEDKDLVERLVAADHEVASALSVASDDWWQRLQKWSAQCGFAGSLWWIAACYTARRSASATLSLAELLRGAADAWIKVNAPGGVSVNSLVSGFQGAMRVGIAQNAGIVREIGQYSRLLPSALQGFAQASPTIMVPGSVVVGLELPRKTPGERASGPADISVDALDFVLAASEVFNPADTPDSLASLVSDDDQRNTLWQSLKNIYNAAGREADCLEISSNVSGRERCVEWSIRHKKQRQAHPVQARTVTGNVRAIDMDRHSLRLRVAGAAWATTVTLKDSLFVHPDKLAGYLGKDVTIRGDTRETVEPPRLLAAVEFPDDTDAT